MYVKNVLQFCKSIVIKLAFPISCQTSCAHLFTGYALFSLDMKAALKLFSSTLLSSFIFIRIQHWPLGLYNKCITCSNLNLQFMDDLQTSTWIFIVNISFYELYIKRFVKHKQGLLVFKVRLAKFTIWFCCLFETTIAQWIFYLLPTFKTQFCFSSLVMCFLSDPV